MFNILRIVIGGTMLFGTAILNAPAHAAGLNRALPHAEQPPTANPCKGSWPYIVRSCLA